MCVDNDNRAARPEELGQTVAVRGPHNHAGVRRLGNEVGDRRVGEQPALPNHDQVIGHQLDLGQ